VSERSFGDKWAETERARGAFVQKIPAASVAGIPDWLHVASGEGIGVVEAKEMLEGPSAFRISQLTEAQRWTLRTVERFGGRAEVVIVGPGRFVRLPYGELLRSVDAKGSLSREAFFCLAERYAN
jgi:hypothetical protein